MVVLCVRVIRGFGCLGGSGGGGLGGGGGEGVGGMVLGFWGFVGFEVYRFIGVVLGLYW